jgi:hypothetical protein
MPYDQPFCIWKYYDSGVAKEHADIMVYLVDQEWVSANSKSSKKSDDDNTLRNVLIGVAIFLFLLVVKVVISIWRRRRKREPLMNESRPVVQEAQPVQEAPKQMDNAQAAANDEAPPVATGSKWSAAAAEQAQSQVIREQ